ncbi:hypothetical protein BC830DRAFT_1170731 [Chytriomyces sp. MP71]|nr:hypothetical protein BC830DRAFT_1170731 [Chytriomyces sp. MP71]
MDADELGAALASTLASASARDGVLVLAGRDASRLKATGALASPDASVVHAVLGLAADARRLLGDKEPLARVAVLLDNGSRELIITADA